MANYDGQWVDLMEVYLGLTAAQLIVAGIGTSIYVNRVWSTDSDGAATPGFVRWTTSAPDTLGADYPPSRGTFGVDTSDYCVESQL